MKYICEYCFKEYLQSPSHYKRAKRHYCTKECLGLDRRGKVRPEAARYGDKHPAWKGKYLKSYRALVINGKKILEHRHIVQESLGRKLSGLEEVHHINGDKIDNRLCNLVVLSKSDHAKLHADLKAGRL